MSAATTPPATETATTDATTSTTKPHPTTTSSATTTDETDATEATDASSTTHPATTGTNSSVVTPPSTTPFVDVPPAGPCAFTPPVESGEVTWIQDGQLRAASDGGQQTCLIDQVSATGPVSWSSDAGRVLLDPATTATAAAGVTPTGFDSSNLTVSLSAPTGTATIGIDPTTHRLMHRGTNGSLTDISFLERTDEAAYYPSGKRIAAVGVDANGGYGIWLSTNVGKDPKEILSVEDPSTPVTNLSWSSDGRILRFIHGFVHELVIDGLQLFEVGLADRQEANLVVSKVDNATAWTTGPCDATGTVRTAGESLGNDVRSAPGSPFAGSPMTVQPVGWLSGSRLVIAARAVGCSGPADLWIWTQGGDFQQVAHAAIAPSVRIPRGAFIDIPEVIEQQAPG
ncbi:MAG: hypothetical protein JWN62_1774 [Acidimicrobiales bacterium]|nr:hypothetical protein [Acidimicrobiales bacterium]